MGTDSVGTVAFTAGAFLVEAQRGMGSLPLATARATWHCQPRHGCQEAPSANLTFTARNKPSAAPDSAPPRGRKCPSQHRTLKTRDSACTPRGWHKGTPGRGTRGLQRPRPLPFRILGNGAGHGDPLQRAAWGYSRLLWVLQGSGCGTGRERLRKPGIPARPRAGGQESAAHIPSGWRGLSCRWDAPRAHGHLRCGATAPARDPPPTRGGRSPFWGPRRPRRRRRGCSPR